MTSPARITTLLIANRGEIARRVIRTARRMGIRTVGVFSDTDARAPHVLEADVAYALGGTSATETYLDQAKILEAIAATGADAVHPGYGFLSENAEFARACAQAGVVFVGPSPDSIEAMGLKDRAKSIARTAGVPVLPDHVITSDDTDSWVEGGQTVGFPLLVKATAGGGGKGMRLVESAEALVEAISDARREAGNSFGNPDVFLERYLPAPRHVEVQVFADEHGNVVHLLERECSVQRRHQKVLEEAPSPSVGPALRSRMGDTAVALVRELGYVGAGTIEFLLDDRCGGRDGDGEFYFLEMNTRLQVEHPVTEEITGLDLVRLQLQVANGDPLGFDQADVQVRGHAIEVRLYAEDPLNGFAPTPGPLYRYRHSSCTDIRWEDGVPETGEVTPFFDPMIAKVVAHAATRGEAAQRLSRALLSAEIHGTITNRNFLVALLQERDFLAGATHTDFIDLHPELLTAGPATPEVVHLAAATAVTIVANRATDHLTPGVPPGLRTMPGHTASSARWTDPSDCELEVHYRLSSTDPCAVLSLTVDGVSEQFELTDLSGDFVRVRRGGRQWACRVATYPGGSVWLNDPDGQRSWTRVPRLPDAVSGASPGGPAAAMAGVVVAVAVRPGDEVKAGDRLVVVEAMKMELPVVAATDGIIEAVHVDVGAYVDAHTQLVTIAGPQ